MIILILTLLGTNLHAANFKVITKQVGEANLSFVQNSDVPEKVFQLKASFADIEKLAPLSPEKLSQLKTADLRNLTMEEFNQLYARVSSGPIPQGDYNGYIMQKPPIYSALKKRLLKQTLLFPNFAELGKMICQREVEDCILEYIWKGKRFWPRNDMDQVMTKTIFNPVTAVSKFSLDFFKSKWTDKIIDFGENLTNGVVTLFPMNTYCGISLVDARRESIITDATFGDDFGLPSYVGIRDEIVTRKGLAITEEYRMLRPGLYIGKVYTNKLFLFNVVLEKIGAIEEQTGNACLTRDL